VSGTCLLLGIDQLSQVLVMYLLFGIDQLNQR